jgi:hypothetical protein
MVWIRNNSPGPPQHCFTPSVEGQELNAFFDYKYRIVPIWYLMVNSRYSTVPVRNVIRSEDTCIIRKNLQGSGTFFANTGILQILEMF